MKKFRSKYGTEIEEFEVVKETDKQVIFLNSRGKEQREAKISGWQNWHDSKEDAKAFLISECDNQIGAHKFQIDMLIQRKNNINKL